MFYRIRFQNAFILNVALLKYEKRLMIKRVILALLIATLVLFFPAKPSFGANTLALTVTTNNPTYSFGNTVYVSGSLMWVPNEIPATNGIVGVEVRDPSGKRIIFRTVATSSITSQNWLVNFTQFYPCTTINGPPTYSFKAGQEVYIYVEFENFDMTLTHSVLCLLTVYDANSVPIACQSIITPTLPPNSTASDYVWISSIPSSTVGNVTFYASLFSDYPDNGGYPFCPETNATFTIATPTTNAPFERSSGGSYNFSFELPSSGKPGKYIVNATTDYDAAGTYYYAANNASFNIKLVGDINGDGVVNILDAILLADAFGSVPGNTNWNPNADLNGDGVVNILDAILLANNFGAS